MGRQHIIVLFSSLRPILGLIAILWSCTPPAAALEPPTTVTIFANPLTRQVLSIQPGFTLFVVFDAPIEFVAIGDEQVLTVAVRGPGGLVALKANQRAGRTNLHIQAGGVLLVFEVRVAAGGRTADVVRVVTAGTATRPTPRASLPPGPEPSPPPPLPLAAPELPPGEGPHDQSPTAGSPPVHGGPVPPTFLSDTQLFRVEETTQAGIRAIFQAYRTPSGIEIRYQLRNASGSPRKVTLTRVLVRTDGKIVLPRVQRHPSDRTASILADGMTETGLLMLGRSARTVELLFPIFPPIPDTNQPPVLFQIQFDDLESLLEVKTP